MTNPTGPGRGLPAKGLKIIIQCLIVSYACFNTAQAQKTSTLWFNSNGQLISYPPEMVQPGEQLAARISLDRNFWAARTSTVLNSWLNVLENLKKPVSPKAVYTFGNGEFKDVMGEMACKMIDFMRNTNYLPDDQEKYYQTRIKMLGIASASMPCKDSFTPSLKSLIEPEYEIVYFFYDDKGGRINNEGKPYCAGDDTSVQFEKCDPGKIKAAAGAIRAFAVTIPPGCSEIRYQLRIKNNTIAAVTSRLANSTIVFPADYGDLIVKFIEVNFDADFMQKLAFFKLQVDTLSKKPLFKGIELKPIQAFVKSGLSKVNTIREMLGNDDEDNQYRQWVGQWLWLTGGVPQINPFTTTTAIFPDSKPGGKASPQEKALYQIFETMVAKGAIEINDLIKIDSGFKHIPRIKAEMDAEANQQPNEPMLQDRLLYSGMLKSSTNGKLLMRHLDALTNYTIMGVNPRKEVMEDERMHILVENKHVPLKLSVVFETTPIGPEDAFLTNQTKHTNGADEAMLTDSVRPGSPSDRERRLAVRNLITDIAKLENGAIALRALPHPPAIPVYFEKDQTPDLTTDLLEHDYQFDAPALATYSVKQTNPDNTEKEVVKGGYRINKLYHFRLKAGVVYSFLKKNDFTETSPGNYTLDDPASGIDGTFGIQYFFRKQNIRETATKFRPFFYAGLSIKKITENFYIGLGSEPVCGLALSVNAHIGKREMLTGDNNFPTGIRSTWGIHIAPAILIDPSLFVRLFTFGNTNRSLIAF